MDRPASLPLIGFVSLFSTIAHAAGSNFTLVSIESSRNELASNNYTVVSNSIRSPLAYKYRRNNSEISAENVILEPFKLLEFAKNNRLSLQPKYIVEHNQNNELRTIVVGLRGNEVWKYDIKSNTKRLMRIGIEKQPSESERIKFESSVLDSRLLMLVQPTKDLEAGGGAVVDSNSPTYSILETSAALFSVQLNSQSEAIISQIGLRSAK
jgi:hypothetical protein